VHATPGNEAIYLGDTVTKEQANLFGGDVLDLVWFGMQGILRAPVGIGPDLGYGHTYHFFLVN
jgi:hypothetical protein